MRIKVPGTEIVVHAPAAVGTDLDPHGSKITADLRVLLEIDGEVTELTTEQARILGEALKSEANIVDYSNYHYPK